MSNRISIKSLVALAFLIMAIAVSPSKAIIQIYGSESCGNCRALRQSLQANHVPYVFYDVYRDIAGNREMWNKIRSITPDSHGIMLPIVDVNGKALINNPTSYEQIKPYLGDAKDKNAIVDTSASKDNFLIVYIYGVERCTRCKALRKSLRAHGVPFIFCDFERSKAVNDEMWDKIRKSVSPTPKIVNEPIVIIGDKALLNEPISYEQIKPYLNEPKAEKKQTDTGSSSTGDVIIVKVYGRSICSNCEAFMKSLQAHNISYMFFDVDKNPAWDTEMWNKVRTVDRSITNVGLPVVDINGKVLINNPTSYEQIKQYLNDPNAEKKQADTGSDSSAIPTVLEVYGRDTCGNCQALMQSLKAHGISYIFFNVDKNPSWNDEMWKKVHLIDPSLKTFTLPVVDINGTVLINNPTSYEQIKQYLNNPNSNQKLDCNDSSCKVSAGDYFTDYQRDVLAEINLVRTNPAGYAAKRLAKESGNGTDNGAINELKRHAGLNPLRLNDKLCLAADNYARFMAQHNVFGHNENGTPFTRIKETGYSFHVAGENIAAGSLDALDASASPKQAAIAFVKQLIIDSGIKDVGHRKNILNPYFKELGVGYFRKSGSHYVNYTVQDFGAP